MAKLDSSGPVPRDRRPGCESSTKTRTTRLAPVNPNFRPEPTVELDKVAEKRSPLPKDDNHLTPASLATLVNRYLEEEGSSCSGEIKHGRLPKLHPSPLSLREEETEEDFFHLGVLVTLLNRLLELSDAREKALYSDVSCILNSFNEEKSGCSLNCRRRFLLSRLKDRGHDAALCESRWPHSPKYYGGDFEYVDVLFPAEGDEGDRLLIDIDFADHFLIARPTPWYALALEAIPSVFVGRERRLLRIVDLMGDAAIRSLKAQEMLLPPWRKLEYLRIKWLARYARLVDSPTPPLCNAHCRNAVLVRSNQARCAL